MSQQAQNDGERGAVAGLTTLERVDRLHGLLHGIHASIHLLDNAREVQDKIDGPCGDAIWQNAAMFLADRVTDCIHEVSALHEQTREAARPASAQASPLELPLDCDASKEWVGPLLKAKGILKLANVAMQELRVDEPCPDGVPESVLAVSELIEETLKRAGWA